MTATAATSGFAYALPALVQDGMSMGAAATLAAVPTIGITAAIIAWGWALDRFGERRILLLSLLITLVGTLGAVVAVATDAGYPALSAALLVGGIGSGAANGASGRIVVGFFPANQRGTAMGIRQMAQPLAIALLALTMPVLADRSGVAVALAIPVAVTVAGLAAVYFGIRDPQLPPSALTAAPDGNPYRSGSYLWRIHAASVLLVIGQGLLWTFVPAWLMLTQGWTPLATGMLVTVTQVLGALGRLVAGRVSDLWGSRMKPIRVIAAAAALTLAALALADWFGSPVAPLMMVFASIATVSDNGLAFTAIAESAGPSWSGRALGVQNTAQFIAIAATTPILGAMIERTGYPVVFAVSALAPLLAVPLIPQDPRPREQPVLPPPAR
ncbi:putative major facilitator superfamily transporter [Gordonia hirsuta DSM 44140 = NBRC 16056]|uniref:Putative major facilitator superfamily transporter n=1 Tax=Gordonia hirsuta DSM 44140 = NBRC 16056 TaxID=1121927 RepID=L7L7W0_9ACTN|nr:putative major facilitator superfamily transporter [Gordonia hirsuta DSM 44140 = NBRC 16056]